MSNDQRASSMKNGFPEYQGKTVIVTGGAKGIGAQIVEQFAQLGAKVAIVDVDNVGEVLAEKWNKDGFNAKYFHCDVSNGNAVKQMITAIENSFDRIDVLINNAGIFPRADFLEMDEAFWDSVMGVNLKGVYLSSQAVAPLNWEKTYGYAPLLMETFVQNDRFAGTCYKAANWTFVGVTKGRGKLDRINERSLPIKDIYLLPLKKNFRQLLQGS